MEFSRVLRPLKYCPIVKEGAALVVSLTIPTFPYFYFPLVRCGLKRPAKRLAATTHNNTLSHALHVHESIPTLAKHHSKESGNHRGVHIKQKERFA